MIAKMVLIEDDFCDEFLAELDVMKIRLTYLVMVFQIHKSEIPQIVFRPFFVYFETKISFLAISICHRPFSLKYCRYFVWHFSWKYYNGK